MAHGAGQAVGAATPRSLVRCGVGARRLDRSPEIAAPLLIAAERLRGRLVAPAAPGWRGLGLAVIAAAGGWLSVLVWRCSRPLDRLADVSFHRPHGAAPPADRRRGAPVAARRPVRGALLGASRADSRAGRSGAAVRGRATRHRRGLTVRPSRGSFTSLVVWLWHSPSRLRRRRCRSRRPRRWSTSPFSRPR